VLPREAKRLAADAAKPGYEPRPYLARGKHARGGAQRKVDYIITIIVIVMIFVMMTIIIANGE
jgi:hypothetical protein